MKLGMDCTLRYIFYGPEDVLIIKAENVSLKKPIIETIHAISDN